ncbi:sigma-54-dependent Fis family transcriptional regulator [Verrucomicrobia bacterium LW23]|nr:sigma-54-dependent Fis family transcriptional regulator [Verrucomicrobia bacterium LW23]
MRILIIDDEVNIRQTSMLALEALGHDCMEADSSAAAIKLIQRDAFDAVFLDLRLGEESGLDVIPKLLALEPKLQIVLFTAYSSIDTAVEAMRVGAFDYLAKPFTPDQLRAVLQRMSASRKLENKVAELESRLSSAEPLADFSTREASLQKVFETATKAATSSATILILGESGTGKSILARAIHSRSQQRDGACITVACPSLSRELLESELFGHVKGAFTGAVGETWGKVKAAEGGTLFLDEIGELPLEIQPKLLRLLQEREYERVGDPKVRKANVRVIAATNQNLEELVKAGKFREDLYYRINVITVSMPALRQRLQDLPMLAERHLEFFVKQQGRGIRGYTPAAMAAMQRYSWPGNLRELRNVVERAVILAHGSYVDVGDLPDVFSNAERPAGSSAVAIGSRVTLEELERDHIKAVLAMGVSMEEAATILGIDPATLYRKRKRLAEEEAAAATR